MGYRVTLCLVAVLICSHDELASAQLPNPAMDVVPLVTKDGVQLRISYFPATVQANTAPAKQVTPVVMLHDFKGTRGSFTSLARRLQQPVEGQPDRPAFAVIGVDLRAHGDSVRQVLPTGEAFDLDPSRLRREDFQAMASLDMEAVRNFLVAKNDAGELNLNKLCLVGAGMGANVAANWAFQDWAAPPLAIGKQGQDVKAMALVSPPWSYSGLTFQAPLRFRPLKENVAWLFVYGEEDSKARGDVNRISRQLERFHPDADETAVRAPSSLRVVPLPSKLQSETLLRQLDTQVENEIVTFFVELVAKEEIPWINRRGRLP